MQKQIKEIISSLDDIQLGLGEVFCKSINDYNGSESDFKLKYFSVIVRSLLENHLISKRQIDQEITNCSWYENSKNEDTKKYEKALKYFKSRKEESNNYKIAFSNLKSGYKISNLKQRIKFRLQSYLDDNVLNQIGYSDNIIEEKIKSISDKYDELCKLVHLNLLNKIDEITFEDIINKLHKLVITFSEMKKEIVERSFEKIEKVIYDELISKTRNRLDELSTHTYIIGAELDDLKVIDINHKNILVQGEGEVNLELQYGSNSDVRKDDGMIMQDSAPMKFKVSFDNKNLNLFKIYEFDFDTLSIGLWR